MLRLNTSAQPTFRATAPTVSSDSRSRSAPAAEDYADAVAALRNGLDAHVSGGVQRALGRPPRDVAEFLASTDWAG